MEGADVVRRLFDAVEAFGGNVAGGLLQILGGHAQGGPHVRTVEPPDRGICNRSNWEYR